MSEMLEEYEQEYIAEQAYIAAEKEHQYNLDYLEWQTIERPRIVIVTDYKPTALEKHARRREKRKI